MAQESQHRPPPAVVSRLSLYLRELQHMVASNAPTTSSSQLGRRLGFTDAQVRKDLAWFGQFGTPGIGYRCEDLVSQIKRILGTDQMWPVALVGAGNLGQALSGYAGFLQQGFEIKVAFDSDPKKVGKTIEGVPVRSLDDLQGVLTKQKIEIAMLAVPIDAAQKVAAQLAQAGIKGILNFSPTTIELPEHVEIVGVDLAIELEQLSFAVVNRNKKP
ncbi:MAG: redox-sensing transcriptional repressor Rex [bacterium]|nr:redox-sensing transcriptional repressor Rex [bacterium]